MNNKDLSIYVHFLYCKSRCPYCDFFRGILPKNFDEKEYVSGICRDLEYMRNLSGEREVKSIFFGGGTPSLLSSGAVARILDEIGKFYNIAEGVEISLEANPNTFERNKFLGFRQAGINRLSLGVQALREDDLKFFGRTHSLEDAYKAIELGVEVFDKFSVDLIYARPKQIFDKWVKEVDEVIKRGIKHISLYQLSIEQGTVFYRKKIEEMPEVVSAKFYEDTVSYLRENGFERYEVSNFSKDVYNRSVHNLVYWNGGDYVGLGKGAAGRLKAKNSFYQLWDGKIEEEISPRDRGIELIIMGFRVNSGIKFGKFFDIVGIDFFEFVNLKKVNNFIDEGFLIKDDESIWLTDRGFLIMDKIILEIVN
ncbi:MAG: radical SAM family heme chaperone HemW [Alphaproteobacteria bacterium]|nr:radical SAM family heme chaperone HemW [Alphaproteobacteria bacterium]